MKLPFKTAPVLYGITVFIVFTTVMMLIKYITKDITIAKAPQPEEYFGIMSNNDIMLGAIVAIVLTFSHERKKRLRK